MIARRSDRQRGKEVTESDVVVVACPPALAAPPVRPGVADSI